MGQLRQAVEGTALLGGPVPHHGGVQGEQCRQVGVAGPEDSGMGHHRVGAQSRLNPGGVDLAAVPGDDEVGVVVDNATVSPAGGPGVSLPPGFGQVGGDTADLC